MRVELGAPVVLAECAPALWHLPAPSVRRGRRRYAVEEAGPELSRCWPALCGLLGALFVYGGVVRRGRLCSVCRSRACDRG